MMTKEGSTKIVNYMTLGAGVLMLGSGHVSHYIEYALSCYINIHHIDCYCITGLQCRFRKELLILFILMGLMVCKYKPF